mmetsp:Transcript_9284/g.27876  ORF Transcript_9284/g.27876 Transcript_9284/m.27876 type:complete len:248 (+) Transcript_9284:3986-4729(+)
MQDGTLERDTENTLLLEALLRIRLSLVELRPRMLPMVPRLSAEQAVRPLATLSWRSHSAGPPPPEGSKVTKKYCWAAVAPLGTWAGMPTGSWCLSIWSRPAGLKRREKLPRSGSPHTVTPSSTNSLPAAAMSAAAAAMSNPAAGACNRPHRGAAEASSCVMPVAVAKAGEQCMARQPGCDTSTKAMGVAKHSSARLMNWRCSRLRAASAAPFSTSRATSSARLARMTSSSALNLRGLPSVKHSVPSL